MTKLRTLTTAVSVLCVVACAHSQPVRQDFPGRLTLERLQQDPPLGGRQPVGLKFSPDGAWLAYLKGSKTDSKVLDLWAVPLQSTGKPRPRVLVRTTDLLGSRRAKLSEEERMANERKRVRHTGITSYLWCGRAGKRLLFPLSGRLYLYDLTTRQTRRIGPEGPKLDVKCSPGGAYVSFVTKGDLFILGTVQGKLIHRTHRATATRRFGVAEFIAQEEMGRYYGHRWSPSERFMVVAEVDLSKVGIKVRPLFYGDRTTLYRQRYPATGETNASITLHVVDLKDRSWRRVAVPPEDGYLPRFGFYGKDKLYVQWQSRDQRRLILFRGDVLASRSSKDTPVSLTTLTETRDKAWVAVHSDLRFLPDGRFIWPTVASGTRQLALHAADGKRLKPLTRGDDPVVRVAAFDAKRGLVWYVRATQRGRSRQLYAATTELGPESEELLTRVAGWHRVRAEAKGRAFVDSFSLPIFYGPGALGREGAEAWFMPPRVTLRGPRGKVRFVLMKNPARDWRRAAKTPGRYVTIRADDGTTLNARFFPPYHRVPGKRYPVIVYVYGGPGAQVVTYRYNRNMPLWAALNQRGFGVFMLDNRGSGGRDHRFTRAIHHRVGDIEVRDQLAGVKYLQTLDWVDPKRIGVYGWSYGGFMSAKLIMHPGTPFASAVSIAPVTDWRLYDTHYTERYLGRPQDSMDRYTRAGVLQTLAKRGGRRALPPLLLVHGMADDNVLMDHTIQLAAKLQAKALPFELMLYPGRAHGLRGRSTRTHVWRTLTRFFERTLAPKRR